MMDYALRTTEIKEAVDLYRNGLSMRQIAERFHVSQTAVRNALILHGVERRERHEARRLRWRM